MNSDKQPWGKLVYIYLQPFTLPIFFKVERGRKMDADFFLSKEEGYQGNNMIFRFIRHSLLESIVSN